MHLSCFLMCVEMRYACTDVCCQLESLTTLVEVLVETYTKLNQVSQYGCWLVSDNTSNWFVCRWKAW